MEFFSSLLQYDYEKINNLPTCLFNLICVCISTGTAETSELRYDALFCDRRTSFPPLDDRWVGHTGGPEFRAGRRGAPQQHAVIDALMASSQWPDDAPPLHFLFGRLARVTSVISFPRFAMAYFNRISFSVIVHDQVTSLSHICFRFTTFQVQATITYTFN